MYMNKSKRNLIIASAIINLISVTANLVMSIMLYLNEEFAMFYSEYYYVTSFTTNLYYNIFSFLIGLVASILLLYSVREKGRYFRSSQGLFVGGLVIIVFCGGYLAWLLLFISMFIPDVIIMNSKSEIRREEKTEKFAEAQKEEAYETKKRKIEELKQLRDNGVITEEEYKQRLFEIL